MSDRARRAILEQRSSATAPEVSIPARCAALAASGMTRPRLALLGPALEDRDLWLWWLAILGMNMSLQILEAAIGWED